VSLRAELIRLYLLWFVKPRREITVEQLRVRFMAFERYIPRPPAGIEIVPIGKYLLARL
jgi:hypothetical protein